MRVPLTSAWVIEVREYQAGLWALKYPMMMSLWELKRRRGIWWTVGVRGEVDVVDVDIVYDGCY